MSTPRQMVNSDYGGMVLRTVTSRVPSSLDVREYEWAVEAPATRGRTL